MLYFGGGGSGTNDLSGPTVLSGLGTWTIDLSETIDLSAVCISQNSVLRFARVTFSLFLFGPRDVSFSFIFAHSVYRNPIRIFVNLTPQSFSENADSIGIPSAFHSMEMALNSKSD